MGRSCRRPSSRSDAAATYEYICQLGGRCVFDDFDAVADVPIPFITPYLYRAYGEGTKVINSVSAPSIVTSVIVQLQP